MLHAAFLHAACRIAVHSMPLVLSEIHGLIQAREEKPAPSRLRTSGVRYSLGMAHTPAGSAHFFRGVRLFCVRRPVCGVRISKRVCPLRPRCVFSRVENSILPGGGSFTAPEFTTGLLSIDFRREPALRPWAAKEERVITNAYQRIPAAAALALCGLVACGCQQKAAQPAQPGGGMQGMPVQTVQVALQSVPQSSEYVSTIKSRRSATIQPQVSGNLTAILAHSGDHVKAGQELMQIDARQQQSAVASQLATARQKKALFDFNTTELERQRKLFDAGITSRDAFEQEQQAYQNSKADYEAAEQTGNTQQELLAYYTIRAPFDGVVGDIPVHLGDYVSPSTLLTTVDANQDLEAYIYIPAERAAQVHLGLPVDIADNSGKVLEHSRVDFVSPQVDPNLQAILVKAPVHATPDILRNAQMVKARVIWSSKPMPVVPVLAVTRQGAQSFVFVAQQQSGHFIAHELPVTLGETVGNLYSVTSGLSEGDRVIVSATQFLVNNMPVMPLGGAAAH